MDKPPRRHWLSRFDIGAKLFLAFGAIAGLTFLAAVIAWHLFDQVSINTSIVAEHSVPGMERSFQLAQESTLLSVSIPRLSRAQDAIELTARKSSTLELLDAIDARLAMFADAGPNSSEAIQLDQIKVIVIQMRENLSQLFAAAQLDLEEKERRRKLLADAMTAHRQFVNVIEPLVQESREAMVRSARRSVADGTAGISSLIDDSFDAMRAALELESNISLLISSSYQAAWTHDPTKYFDLISANVLPISRIKGAFNQINDSETSRQLKNVSERIVEATTGPVGIFDVKGQILRLADEDDPVLRENLQEKLNAGLRRLDALQQQFAEVNSRSIASVDESILSTATRMAQEGRGMIDRTREGVRQLETILLIRSSVNQLFGLLNQAATAIAVGDINPLQKRYQNLRERLRHLLAGVRSSVDSPEFQSAAEAVARYGSGKHSIIETRRRELVAHTEMAYYLEDGQRLASELSQLAATFVEEAKRAAAAATTDTLQEVASGKISVVGIAIVCFLAVVLIAWLFVARGIVRRLKELTSTMLAISDGRLETPIAIGKSDDEISDMSRSLVVFRDNAMKRRLAEEAMREAKESAEQSLSELQVAQRRLVQSEKMASLGQLTAGIAHEIKNPLNFVTNFAVLSRDLLDEVKELTDPRKTGIATSHQQEIDEIFNDLDLNLEKINEHGRRADSIVRGMLVHSRESDSVAGPVDLNQLLQEYTNLAYHGMRANHSDFNVTINWDLDSTIENIELVSQDIGRVFLNIISNAFYAIYDIAKSDHKFEPAVYLSTRKHGDFCEVRIRDNGPGIPSEVIEKVFQPFFTTKPPGEGTGLGLSISYDIIVGQHGGTLEVYSNNGAEFVIRLPLHPTRTIGRVA